MAKRSSKKQEPTPIIRPEVIGLILLALALLTTLSLLSISRGAFTEGWLRLLRGLVGWGMYLAPVGLAMLGIWLLRRFAGEDPQVTLSSADKNGKVNVIVGDKKDPESGERYQDLVNKKKNILKNDPTNTRVLDEIEKELEKIALRQEAQRVMEERFPDGPPPPPSPEQAQALNQNMAMMQMLQGADPRMQPTNQAETPIPGMQSPEAVPLAQTGMIEGMAARLGNIAGGPYEIEQMIAAMQEDPTSPYFDPNAYISSPFNTNFLDENKH